MKINIKYAKSSLAFDHYPKFLRLIGNQIEIDLKEYYLSEIDQILGILKSAIQNKE